MKASILTTSVGLALAFAITTQGAAQQSGLLVGFRADEYFSESYTPKSREDAVFFRGEPILFRLIVRNMGPSDTTLTVASTDPKQLFSIEGFRAPALPPDSTKRRLWVNGRFDDEEAVVFPVSPSAPVKGFSGGTQDLRLGPRTTLGAGESVQWVLRVRSEELQPGYYYRFVVKVNGTEDEKKPLQDFANIRFELRASTSDAQPEILRREALRRLFQNDYIGARQAVSDLLRVHPNSYEAYRTLEMIAQREGQTDEANKHRAAADAILKSGRDQLWLKFTPRERKQR